MGPQPKKLENAKVKLANIIPREAAEVSRPSGIQLITPRSIRVTPFIVLSPRNDKKTDKETWSEIYHAHGQLSIDPHRAWTAEI